MTIAQRTSMEDSVHLQGSYSSIYATHPPQPTCFLRPTPWHHSNKPNLAPSSSKKQRRNSIARSYVIPMDVLVSPSMGPQTSQTAREGTIFDVIDPEPMCVAVGDWLGGCRAGSSRGS
ncbi:hypothetical protein QOT17_013307 [Balamuthia mandrillaris]